MKYIVRLVEYAKNEKGEPSLLDVYVPEEDLPSFLEAMKKGDVSWDSEQKKFGFFMDPAKVRFIQLIREDTLPKGEAPSVEAKEESSAE